jgi:hypothetical protein
LTKWKTALFFAIVGYVLAIVFAAPFSQPFLIRSGLPSWMGILAIPIVAYTSSFPIDPDAGMIYIIFGGSNAILYGIVGLVIGKYREKRTRSTSAD